MEQNQNIPQQKPSVRRRYTPTPEPENVQQMPAEAAPPSAESSQPAPAKRRAQRRHSEAAFEEASIAAPVMPAVTDFEQPVQEKPVSPMPEPCVQIAEQEPQETVSAGNLSKYDKRNSAHVSTKAEKRPEEKHLRFSDKHLSEKNGSKMAKPIPEASKNEKPGKQENPHREKLKKFVKEKMAAEDRHKKNDEPEQSEQPILTSRAYDMRLNKQQPQPKKKVFRKTPLSAAKSSKAAESRHKEKAESAPRAVPESGYEAAAETAAVPQKFQYPSQYTSQKHQAAAAKTPAVEAKEATPAETPAQKPSLRKRLPYYIGIALCSVVLIVSGSMLLKYYSQIWRANNASGQLRDLYKDNALPVAEDTTETAAPSVQPQPGETEDEIGEMIEEIIPEPTDEVLAAAPVENEDDFLNAWPKKYPGNEQLKIQERFTPLRHQNRDIVGWLTIEGVVDEPVFQRDNNFYLTHDATGAKNPTGALFLDENCNLRSVPMMTLVHGHNMKEGAMFGSLKKYKVKDASYYKAHPFVTFDTLYEKATYVIFAVAEVNIVPGNKHYFPFWHQFSFGTKDSFEHFVLLAKEYSRFKVDIDVAPGDRLLTLATCSSDDSNLRLIVMARMLRENEDEIMLTNKIYSATAQ